MFIADTIEAIEYDLSETAIAWREHAAYKECVQFDGDVCDACIDFERAIERQEMHRNRAKRALRAITIYNRTYARLARVVAHGDGSTLVVAHNRAAAHTAEVLRGGRTCGNCAGSGVFSLKNARTQVDGSVTPAVCFGCHGKGRQDDADRARNATYWAKYARVSA